MKTFFIVCLAVAAYADPDAQLLLNSPFYSGLSPLAVAAPVALQQPLTYTVAAAPVAPVIKVEEKKVDDVVEVEAEKVEKVVVEAPKVAVYAAPAPQQVLSYAAPAPQQVLSYAALPYAAPAVVQQVAIAPRYVAKNGAVEHIVAKREAEPQLVYSAAPAINPYLYSAAVAQPVVYNAQPVVYNTAATTLVNPLEGVMAKTYANDFNPFTQDYAAKGQYVADSVGAKHIAKREATDMQTPWAHRNAPWATLNAGTPARTFSLNGQRLYKREAHHEAAAPMAMAAPANTRSFTLNGQKLWKREAEAEAEPQFLYSGAYGYNYNAYSPVYSGYNYGYPYAAYSGLRYF